MASADSGRRPGDGSSPLSSATESALCGVTSHPVDDISMTPGSMTPASGQSQNGSPASEDSSRYSPLSQPFGERPLNRTSAGAAVRQSISNLPSPPPFTPEHTSGVSMASPDTVQHPAAAAAAGTVSPVPFSPDGGMSAAGSCGSSGPAAGAYTPGVSSGWGFSSSTKAAACEGFAFARHPAATSNAGSPDVQPFAGNVVPGTDAAAAPSAEPSPLLLQTARNMAASHNADTASERSSVSGASRSSSMRDSHHGAHGSPAMLLRKAKAMIDRQVAVGGTARLSRGSKGSRHSNALQTPADKGIPTATTPQNTPMDVEAEHCGDQQTLLPALPIVVAPVIAVGSPINGTPGSVSYASKGSPVAAEAAAEAAAATPRAAERVTTPVQLASPADSHTSVVSIGSVCTPASVLTAANVSARRLDFTEAVNEMKEAAAAGSNAASTATPTASPQRQQQQLLQGSYSSGLTTSELLPATPMTLEELEAKMLSSATKAMFAREMPEVDIGSDGEFSFDNNKYSNSIDGAAVVEAFSPADTEAAAAAAPKRRGLLGKSCSTLLWLLAGFALVATSFVAVEMLPQTLAPPGCFCTEQNIEACLKADQALNKEMSSKPAGWRLAAKQVTWYLQDAADVLLRRRLPKGITADDFSRAWIASVSEEQWGTVPVEKAAALFAAVPQHLWPKTIVGKLQGPEGAAALLKQQRQAAPEDLVAASSAESAAADNAAAGNAVPAEVKGTAVPAAADIHVEEHQPAEQQTESQVSSMPAADEAAEPADEVEAAVTEVEEPAAAAAAAPEQDKEQAAAAPAAEPAPASAESEEPSVVAETATAQTPVPEATAAEDAAAVQPAAATEEPAPAAEPVQLAGERTELAVEQEAAMPEATEEFPAATEQQEEQQQHAEDAAEAAVEPAPEKQQQQQQDVEPAALAPLSEPEEEIQPPAAADSQDAAAAAAAENDWQVPKALQEEQPEMEVPEVPSAEPTVSTTEQQQDAVPAADADAVPVVRATALQTVFGAILAFVGACAAMFFLPAIKGWLLGNQQEPEEEEQQDEAAGHDEQTAGDMAAAAEEAEAAAAAATPADEDPNAGLLSDEEEVPRRQRNSAAAGKSPMQALLGDVGAVAGMAATILTPRSKPPLPPGAAAEGGAGPSAAAAAAGGRTPRVTRSGGAAAATGGRRTTRSASGAAGAAAAGAESDGEEVAQPPSAGRGRRAAAATPRGRRTSVLPAVPEDTQGAGDANAGLLSDEEAAAPPARARGRRQSAPAAGAAAAPAASGGRRRSAAAAGAAAAVSGDSEQPAVAPRATRRSSRLE